MPKKESKLQRQIRDHLEKTVGGFWFKSHGGPFQMAGLPDLIGCVEGLYFGFEIKLPDDKRSKTMAHQEVVLKMIKYKGGGYAAVITDPQDAEDRVRDWLKKNGKTTKNKVRRLSKKMLESSL